MTHRTHTPSLKQQRGLISAALIAVIVILATLSALVITNLGDEDTAVSDGGIELSPAASEVEPQVATEGEQEQPSFFSSPAASDIDTATSAPVTQQDTTSDSLAAEAISDDETYTETGYSGDDGTTTVVYDAEEERKVQEWWGSIQSSLKASDSSSSSTSESASSFTSESSTSNTSDTSDTADTGSSSSDTTDTSDSSSSTETSDGVTYSDPTTYCGKTEFELYAWYQTEPDAAFQFMWDCEDI